MNDSMEYWLVEQFVDLGNESFFHEKSRLFRHRHDTTEGLTEVCHKIGTRDVLKHEGRYRIRVVKEETVFDSGEGQ
ncbi:hypothetical protein [Streptomyces sp. WG5]|uniref:hypothetical protein n=1 Tax=Streptomyces sp. WG5 TaxID=3417648 RepID=UPI003CE8BDCB